MLLSKRSETVLLRWLFFLFIGSPMGYAQLEDLGAGVLTMDHVRENARTYRNNMVFGGRQYAMGAKAGVVLELGPRGHSGYRVYLSYGMAKNFSQGSVDAILSYQLDLVLFTRGLGASALPSERDKSLLELRNHIGIGVGGSFSGEANSFIWGRPLNPNIGDETSVLSNPMDISLQLGTVFISGLNHPRHQQIGFAQGAAGPFNLFYMNDGPPFHLIGLGDSWDRYWTGVGGAGLFWLDLGYEVTSFELRYSRYTGDEPFLYDLSSDMRMNYLPHKDRSVQFFNKGRYQYRLGFRNFAFAGFNIYQPTETDIQKLIHNGTWALHSNPTQKYFTLFGSYNLHQTYLIQ